MTSGATAQELATLHVAEFALSADRTELRVGEPFHVTIAARLGERLETLDNVTLPNLSGFDELGDERRCTQRTDATACLETLTLAATNPGEQTIAPATLTAVDARNGRPSRFRTNALVLRVAEPAAPSDHIRDAVYALLAGLMYFALGALFLSVGALGVWWLARRSRAPRRFAPAAAPPLAAPSDTDSRPAFDSLVAALAAEPTRERVAALRHVLRTRASARSNETLADLLARQAAPNGTASAALAALERAAFCDEAYLPHAVSEALPYLH